MRRSDEERIGCNPQHHQSAAAATALPVVPEKGFKIGISAGDILRKIRPFLFQVVFMLIKMMVSLERSSKNGDVGGVREVFESLKNEALARDILQTWGCWRVCFTIPFMTK